MKVLTVFLIAVITTTVAARRKKEWQLINPERAVREHFRPFYLSDKPICTRGEGFYRDPQDCHQFIRCVDEFGSGRHFNVVHGRCEPGLVFDEKISACNWPELSAPCSNSPEKLQDDQNTLQTEFIQNVIPEENSNEKPYPVRQQEVYIPQESSSYDPQQQEVWQVQIVHPPEESNSYHPKEKENTWHQKIQTTPKPNAYDQIQKEVSWQQQPTAQEVPQKPLDTDGIEQQDSQNFDEQNYEQVIQQANQENIKTKPGQQQIQASKVSIQEKIEPGLESQREAEKHQVIVGEPNYGADQINPDSSQQQISSSGFQEIGEQNQQFEISANKEQVQHPQETQSQWWIPENSGHNHPPKVVGQIPASDIDRNPVYCETEGFFQHPENCSQFIRCVKFDSGAYAVHFFECPKQLMFSEKDSACVIANTDSCKTNSRRKRQATGSAQLECRDEGFFRHPKDCRAFYRCVKSESGSYETHMFSCPANLVFDEEYTTCNWPEKAPPCNNQAQGLQKKRKPAQTERPFNKPIRTTSKVSTSKPRNDFMDKTITQEPYSRRRSTYKPKTTSRSSYQNAPKCKSQGFYKNDNDCTKFFKCVWKENRYVRYDLACPNSYAFDDRAKRCIAQSYVASCYKNKPPYPPRQKDEETTISPETTSAKSSTSESSDSSNADIVCEQEGYFQHPEDCNKFYRCVDFNGDGREFVRYDFKCPEDLVFDETNSVCNWPDPTKPCESRSTGEGGGQEGGDKETGQEGSTEGTGQGEGSEGNGEGETGNETGDDNNGNQDGPSSVSGEETSTESAEITTSTPGENGDGEQGGSDNESGSDNDCTKEGFYRNPEDCNKFYRCVDFNEEGKEFVRYDFTCPEGLVFDEVNSVCNWPSDSEPCDTRSGTGNENGDDQEGTGTTTSGNTDRQEEPSEGTSSGNDQTTSNSNASTESSSTEQPSGPQESSSASPDRPSEETTSDTNQRGGSGNNGECTEAGYYRNPEDCNKFYRCVDYNGDGQQFVKYDFSCPEGLVFDETNSVCNWPEQSAPCETGSRPEGESTLSGEEDGVETSSSPSDNGESSQSTSGSDASSQTTAGSGESSSDGPATEDSSTVSTNSDKSSTESTGNGGSGSTTSSDTSSDSAGESTTDSTRGGSSSNTGECTEEGFFRNPEDCGKFYRCVDFNGDGQQYVRYDFDCPEGLVFDEVNSVCNWPDQSPGCETGSQGGKGEDDGSSSTDSSNNGVTEGKESTTSSEVSSQTESSSEKSSGPTEESTESSEQPAQSSTTEQSTSPKPESGNSSDCTESGFFRCEDDCNKFYRCVEQDGKLQRYDFKCPDGLIFDDRNKKCDWPSSELTCDTSTSEGNTGSSQSSTTSVSESSATTATTSQPISTTQSSTSSSDTSPSDTACTEEGYFRNPDDCSRYYRCIDEGDGRLTREDFACAEDEVFDEEMRYCNRKDLAPPCDSSQTSSQSTTEGTTSSQTTSSQISESSTKESQSTTERTTSSQSSTESSTKSSEQSECSEQGFFQCPEDCTKFYRCVEQDDGSLVRYDFNCPDGLIFDESNKRCDFPSEELTCNTAASTSPTQSPTSSSQTTSSTTSDSSGSTSSSDSPDSSGATSSTQPSSAEGCTEEGYFRNPDDCSKYYRCLDEGDGTLSREDFACEEDEVFDDEMKYCNRKDLAPPCDETSSSTTGSSQGSTEQSSSEQPTSESPDQESSSTTASSNSTSSASKSGECQEEGFHRDPNDCGKFYRCVDFKGDGQSFTRYDFDCPEGLVFDENNDVCNWPSSVPSCESNEGSGGSAKESSSTTSGPSSSGPSDENSESATSPTEKTSTTSSGEESTVSSSEDQTSQTQSSSASTSETASSSNDDSTTSGKSTTQSDNSGSTRGSSSNIECTEEGFFRHPEDCNKFYRCVDFRGDGQSFTRYDFDCPEGLVFDEVNSVCNWPNQSPRCETGSQSGKGDDGQSSTGSTNNGATENESSSQSTMSETTNSGTTSVGESGSTESQEPTASSSQGTTSSSSDEFICEDEGYFKHPTDCKKYYECKRDEDTGELVKIDCECPDGHVWDNEGWYCNAKELSPPCDESSSSFKCKEEGFFRDPEDCTKYYQCNRTGPGEDDFESQQFQCEDGLVFDESGRYCNAPELSESCDGSSSSTRADSSTSSSETSDSSTSGSDTTDSSTSTSGGQCTREGFFRNPEDCTKYYQCSRNENTGELDKTDYSCPDGRIFDESSNYCNEPELSEEPCDTNNNEEATTSQQTTSTESSSSSSDSDSSTGTRGGGGDPQCTQEGFYRHPNDCNKFYRCVDFSGSGESFVRYDFDCPEGLHFDEVNSVCNWPTMTPPCESGSQSFRRYLGRVN